MAIINKTESMYIMQKKNYNLWNAQREKFSVLYTYKSIFFLLSTASQLKYTLIHSVVRGLSKVNVG